MPRMAVIPSNSHPTSTSVQTHIGWYYVASPDSVHQHITVRFRFAYVCGADLLRCWFAPVFRHRRLLHARHRGHPTGRGRLPFGIRTFDLAATISAQYPTRLVQFNNS